MKSVETVLAKLGLFLTKLNCEKCNNNETITKFFNLLQEQEKQDLESIKILIPVLTKWIKETIIKWNKPTKQTLIFTLKLAIFLSKSELRFCDLTRNNLLIKLINSIRTRPENLIKLNYTKLFLVFLEHKSGIEWFPTNNFWQDILLINLTTHDEFIQEQSMIFFCKFLDNCLQVDANFCEFIIKKIMLPLNNSCKCLKAPTTGITIFYLGPTLELIGNILDYFLEKILIGELNYQILLIFYRNFHPRETITDFLLITELKNLIFLFGKLMFIMQFLKLYLNILCNSLSAQEIHHSIDTIRTNFILSISKGSYEDVLKFCDFAQLFWNLFYQKFPILQTQTKKSAPIHDQMIRILLFANNILLINYSFSLTEIRELVRDEFRDGFFDTMAVALSADTYRACLYWRQHLFSRSNDLYSLAEKSLNYIKKSRRFFSRHSAVVTFQSLIYTCKDFIHAMKKNLDETRPRVDELFYFYKVFQVLIILIEEFSINWKDGLEVMDVMVICFDFLNLRKISIEIIVECLKLMNVGIGKYMTPNMALLVDNTDDSIIDFIGPLVYGKLNDGNWLVRKTALDVVFTIACIARKQFPSLQKVLMDSELPTLVVKMSANDSESFVRATAIKCLQEMIQVEEIWNNALKSEDLTQKMRQILINETEGIVRVEAATFMCVAYEHQQFPKNTLEEIYETMIYSSTTDLHWEVKVRALEFWDKVIKNHLQNQGMIDGTFPNVTFSKEHRKIVTLTDSEIRKRLLKVLNQLSSIGCLGVLTSAIKDDCDMEVAKTAVKITQRLVDLFKKYNVRSNYSTPTSPTPTENCMSATVSLSSGISVDEFMDSPSSTQPDFNEDIIEQIVNTKDVNLLRNVYSPSDYGSVSNYDIQVRKIINPNEFLQFTQQDLNNVITEKKKWLNGIEDLGSLLDDMLKTYDDDVNNMDCY